MPDPDRPLLDVLVVEYDHPPDLQVYARVLGGLSAIRLTLAATRREALDGAAVTQVLVAKAHDATPDLVAAMPHLRMVQALTTGTDALARARLPPGVVVASGRGVHGPQMAELALLMMLSLTRDTARLQRNQAAGVWERWPQPVLDGKIMVVLGVGLIAEDVASRAHAFGMRVLGVSSRAEAPHFDRLYDRADLHEAAAAADYLLVLAPYTPATHHMVDASLLAALKPSAFLINLARGGVVDEAALTQALRTGRIAGAGLDVFAHEPLPVESPLWKLPNVLITPHIGGMSDRYAETIAPLVAHNLAAFSAGRLQDMRNVVSTDSKASNRDEKQQDTSVGAVAS